MKIIGSVIFTNKIIWPTTVHVATIAKPVTTVNNHYVNATVHFETKMTPPKMIMMRGKTKIK